MKYLACLVVLLLAGGCEEKKSQPVVKNEQLISVPESKSRIEIVEARQFITPDGHYRRTILLVKDKETGREFVAIHGFGVTELGSKGHEQ